MTAMKPTKTMNNLTATTRTSKKKNCLRNVRRRNGCAWIVAVSALSVLALLGLEATTTLAFTTTTRSHKNDCCARQMPASFGSVIGSGTMPPRSTLSSRSALPGDKNENSEWTPNDIFEGIKNFFMGNNGDANTSSSPTSQFFNAGRDASDDDDDDELPAGTSLLLKISAKQLKPGGLRLFLMFYLLGMQNTPDRSTWRADQKLMSVNVTPQNLPEGLVVDPDDDDDEKKYVLEMLYDKDRTGMLQIELLPNDDKHNTKQPEIRIYRCGSRPSTSYLMQESVIVDGVLDELQNLSAGGGSSSTEDENDIAEEDRLLIPDPENAIEEARESLAFG